MGWSTARYPRKKTSRRRRQIERENNSREKLEKLIRENSQRK